MLLQTHSGEIPRPAPNREPHVIRGAVPPQEKLLLVAILLVVAGWIFFRMALMLAMFG